MDQTWTLGSESALPSTSSPAPAVFSEEPTRSSSPPSSPPGFPWEQDDASKTVLQPAPKSAFSLLGKRKALESVSDNVRPAKKPAIPTEKLQNGALTQMQISIGQEMQKRCKTCGMEYVPSSTEDRKLHDMYHKQNTEGYDVGKDFVRNARKGAVFGGANKGDTICMIDCHDKPSRKKKAQAVLDIVQRELGAVEIDQENIWDARRQDGPGAKFRSYLYVRGTRCVGFLLVERICEAWEVVAPSTSCMSQKAGPTRTKRTKASDAVSALKQRRQIAEEELQQARTTPIELSTMPRIAALGVSRIWTSSAHRRQNIASALLDTALKQQNQNIEYVESSKTLRGLSESRDIVKERLPSASRQPDFKAAVAFSQPTDSGAMLARRWFGKLYGWSVYVD